MNRIITLTFAVLFLFQAVVAGVPERKLGSLMELYHSHNNFTGTVLVARDGEVLFAQGYGYASLEHLVPNTPETKFRIASISKQFTSMLVMQQVSEGKMSLDAPLRAYIDDYPAPQGDVITIHHLLSHTSGMPHYAGIENFFPLYGRLAFTHREFVELFWGLDLLFDPGEEYSYSSFGYYLLGYILEEVTGKDFATLLYERILEPLGMFETGIVDHREVLPRKASGYDMRLTGFDLAEFRDLSTALATGDMYTSATDMVRWDQALSEYTLLSKELQDKIFTPNLSGYGYGWNIGYRKTSENDSVLFHQHTGGTNGFTSIGTRIPGDGYYIVVFCNTRPAEIRPIEQDIIRILYGNTPEFSPSAAIAAARILENEGVEEATAFLAGLISEATHSVNGFTYSAGLQDIVRVGRDCLHRNDPENALEFFRLGTELYPDSATAWIALGDGYHDAGQKEEAITAYAHALIINPRHAAALQRLHRY